MTEKKPFDVSYVKITDGIYGLNFKLFQNIIRKKVHHILIIHNEPTNNFVPCIQKYYPKMLRKCYDDNLNSCWIIYTHPTITVIKCDLDKLYYSFSKIYNSFHRKILSESEHTTRTISDECDKIIKTCKSNDQSNLSEYEIVYIHTSNSIDINTQKYFDLFVEKTGKISIIHCDDNDPFPMQSDNTKHIKSFIGVGRSGIKIYEFIKSVIENKLIFPNYIEYSKILSENVLSQKYDIMINDTKNNRKFLGIDFIENTFVSGKIFIYNAQDTKDPIRLSITQKSKNEIRKYDVELALTGTDNITNTLLCMLEDTIDLGKLCSISDNNYEIRLQHHLFFEKILRNFYIESFKNKDYESLKNTEWIYEVSNKLMNDLITFSTAKQKSNSKYSELVITYAQKAKSNIIDNKQNKQFNKILLKNFSVLKEFDDIEKFKSKKTLNFIDEYSNDSVSMSDDNFITSCDFFVSPLTLTNWFDELKNCNAIGLFINVNVEDINKYGTNTTKYEIVSITDTLVPINEYLESTISYFNKHNEKMFGDLTLTDTDQLDNYDTIISPSLGTGNTVIPLYINKYHWDIASKYLPISLGITLAHNPAGYTDKHIKFMFVLLMKMTNELLCSNKNINCRTIQCYMAIFRTCIEIAKERKYIFGIKTLVKEFLSNKTKRMKLRTYEYDSFMGQLLCTGCKLSKNDLWSIIDYSYENMVRTHVSKTYSLGLIKNLFQQSVDDITLSGEIEMLLQEVTMSIKRGIDFLISFYNMYNIIQKLVEKIGSYNQFVKTFDKHYGYFPDDLTEWIRNEINRNKTNSCDIDIHCLYEMRNLKIDADAVLLQYIFKTLESASIDQNESLPSEKCTKQSIITEYKKKYGITTEMINIKVDTKLIFEACKKINVAQTINVS